jgi:hypothetical protein
MFRTHKPADPTAPDAGDWMVADLYPLAGAVSIATYLVIECLLG